MTTFQKARRFALLRGGFITLSVLSFLMLLSALADRVTQ